MSPPRPSSLPNYAENAVNDLGINSIYVLVISAKVGDRWMTVLIGDSVEESRLHHPVELGVFTGRVALVIPGACSLGAYGTELAALYEPGAAVVQSLDTWHVGLVRLRGPRSDQVGEQPLGFEVDFCGDYPVCCGDSFQSTPGNCSVCSAGHPCRQATN